MVKPYFFLIAGMANCIVLQPAEINGQGNPTFHKERIMVSRRRRETSCQACPVHLVQKILLSLAVTVPVRNWSRSRVMASVAGRSTAFLNSPLTATSRGWTLLVAPCGISTIVGSIRTRRVTRNVLLIQPRLRVKRFHIWINLYTWWPGTMMGNRRPVNNTTFPSFWGEYRKLDALLMLNCSSS